MFFSCNISTPQVDLLFIICKETDGAAFDAHNFLP